MSALSHPGYRLYFAAAVPLVHALWAQRVVLGWLAWEASGSAAFVGFVAAVGLAPMWVAGPLFGVLVDRTDILRALRATSGAMAAVLVLAAAVEAGPGLGQGGLLAVALATGLITAAHHPIRMSLVPRLVPPADVHSVVAISALNFNLARLVAPVLTGLALATAGAVATLWVAAALYIPMLLASGTLAPRPLPDAGPPLPMLRGMGEGLAHIRGNPTARLAVALTFVMAVSVRGYLELLPVMAEGVHARGAEGLGWLTAAAGAGAVVAAAGKAVGLGAGAGVSGAVRAVLLAAMAALAGLGATASWPGTLAWTAALGFCSTFAGVSLQAAVQAELPDGLRGRVMSLWVLVGLGSVALGAGAMGLGAAWFGLPATLVAAGLGGAAVVALALPRPRRGLHVISDRRGEMALTDDVRAALAGIGTPMGGDLIARDMVRALSVEGGRVAFVIEAPDAEAAASLEPLRAAAAAAVERVPGVASVRAVLTAPTKSAAPPQLKVGGHPKPQDGPLRIPNVARVLAVASGKGGVGKSTVSANLAVALARAGRKVGLLDADIYGPSQPRMMGLSERPQSPDGKRIIPLHAHGVTVMSIGLMLPE